MLLSRRKLLELLSKHTITAPCLGSYLLKPQQLLGSNRGKHDKFLLYIHFGSADGLTTGMLQPKEVVIDGDESGATTLKKVGAWQKHLFWGESSSLSGKTSIFSQSQYNRNGADPNLSINPNVNIHYQDQGKSLIFNEYSKVLLPIQDHICMAVGNSRSLAHHDAASFQVTGERSGSDRGTWVANFAQATCGDSDFANIVVSPEVTSPRGAIYTKIFNTKGLDNKNVVITNASSLAEIHNILSDPPGIPNADGDARKFWQLLKKISSENASKYPHIRKSAGFYIENLLAGVPELAENNSTRSTIEQRINLVELQNTLTDNGLPQGSVCDVDTKKDVNKKAVKKLIENLQLAAGMAITRRAKGMLLSYGDHDHHSGGSSLHTPRQGAILFSAVRMFWEWVTSQGMQNDIMVIISHDFTRTPYNDKEKLYTEASDKPIIKARRANGAIEDLPFISVGNDHHPLMSMIFINGKVPPASRVGGIFDNYTAFGANNTKGKPNLDIPPYISDDLVGTMMQRCFDDIFPDEKTVKEFFPGLDKSITWLL